MSRAETGEYCHLPRENEERAAEYTQRLFYSNVDSAVIDVKTPIGMNIRQFLLLCEGPPHVPSQNQPVCRQFSSSRHQPSATFT